MKKPRIGILGGMGPAATILLQQRVLNAVRATSDADHIPLLIDMNPQIPSRIDYLIHGTGENPGPVLVHMARCIEASDVDAIAMPCCTAHHFADEIANAISVPFLNMVDLAARAVADRLPRTGSVGILASPANIKTRLFEKALRPYGLTARFPNDMQKLLSIIKTFKTSGSDPESIALLQSIINEMTAGGTNGFLIGCTEFSLISESLSAPVPMIDALDQLTLEIVAQVDLEASQMNHSKRSER